MIISTRLLFSFLPYPVFVINKFENLKSTIELLRDEQENFDYIVTAK
jgi:hypothetical protein